MRALCITLGAISMWLVGCTMGPNYHRPQVQIPAEFRAPQPLGEDQASLADTKWFEVFQDPQLQALVRTALTRNFDLRDAVTRVEQARANLGVTRSNQFPQANATGEVEATRLSRNGNIPLPSEFLSSQNRTWGQSGLNLLSFELDLWGRLRRSTEAARANLLSAEENRKTVLTTLVSDIASNYFQLLELDDQLALSRRTLRNRQDFLRLTEDRQAHGIATLLDLRQAEQLVDSAAQSIPPIEQQIEQTENQVALLLGDNPHPLKRIHLSLVDEKVPPEVPPGLPSALLERRPDIRAAEATLIAANANIGVAKAAYFPQITLSGFLGGQSTQLSTLFAGPNSMWTFTPQVAQPVSSAGKLKSNVKLAEAQREQAQIAYEKSIQTAFAEVSNALIAHQHSRESRIEQEKLVAALQDRKRIAYLRYQGGVDTQLNALDADRDLFSAELALAQTRLTELLSVVQLYKALGGGWQL